MGEVSERMVDVDGVGIFVREVAGDGPPVVFAHGNPTHSADWLPFLERIDAPAIAFDLPGWGRSDRPSTSELDYTMHGLARFFGRCLDRLEVDRYSLVVHDWGVVGLLDAIEHAHRLERLVSFNVVPPLPGYRWHWLARFAWRRRGVGELFNAAVTRPAASLVLRQANHARGGMPEAFIDQVMAGWPRGAWPQMLTLYRSADPDTLAAAGYGLGRIQCPALILWPLRDPYLGAEFGRRLAARIPGSELVEVDDAGHWPWIDHPELIGRALDFLSG
ncbi:MAG: alpha/beta fold hydrolase [Solirubrobacterales bacterium]